MDQKSELCVFILTGRLLSGAFLSKLIALDSNKKCANNV